MARLPRVTILQLDPRCPAGPIEGWLKDAGVRLSQVSLWDRDVPPIASIGEGLVILGGTMSALSAAEDPVLGALSGEVVVAQSHHDVVVRLPEGAVELARTARYGNQAFRLGSSWGVQFHPEATPELIEDWSRRSPRRAEVVAEVTAARDAITASGRAVAQAFAQVVRG